MAISYLNNMFVAACAKIPSMDQIKAAVGVVQANASIGFNAVRLPVAATVALGVPVAQIMVRRLEVEGQWKNIAEHPAMTIASVICVAVLFTMNSPVYTRIGYVALSFHALNTIHANVKQDRTARQISRLSEDLESTRRSVTEIGNQRNSAESNLRDAERLRDQFNFAAERAQERYETKKAEFIALQTEAAALRTDLSTERQAYDRLHTEHQTCLTPEQRLALETEILSLQRQLAETQAEKEATLSAYSTVVTEALNNFKNIQSADAPEEQIRVSLDRLDEHSTTESEAAFAAYVAEHCQGTNLEDAQRYVAMGNEILHFIWTDALSVIPASPESIKYVVWALMAHAINKGQGFSQGTFLVHNTKVLEYLMLVQEKYSRWSSHYTGCVEAHYGIDIPGLPANKRTIVFGMVPILNAEKASSSSADNRTFAVYIKPEDHGCQFGTADYSAHVLDAVPALFKRAMTQLSGSSSTTDSSHRKEHFIKKGIKGAFKDIFDPSSLSNTRLEIANVMDHIRETHNGFLPENPLEAFGMYGLNFLQVFVAVYREQNGQMGTLEKKIAALEEKLADYYPGVHGEEVGIGSSIIKNKS